MTDGPPSTPAEIRISLTLPGAVSLGAFEAGAMASLGVGLGALARTWPEQGGPAVRIDVVGATSSGALAGLLLARSLLEGGDPVAPQELSWVGYASLRRLRGRGWSFPLSYRQLRVWVRELLQPPPPGVGHPTQATPIRFTVALTNLRGLAYRLPVLAGTGPPVVTHLDWIDRTMEAGVPTEELFEPPGGSIVDSVLASAANQMGFPPELLARAGDRDRYQAEGVVNFPTSGHFWYSDAALLDREPLARTLRLARQVDEEDGGDFRRVHLLVRPQPQRAGTGEAWADPRAQPRWTQVLRRSLAIQQQQSIFDDLAGIEDTNDRLDAVDRLTAALAPVLAAAAGADPEKVRAALAGPDAQEHPGSGGESIEALLRAALSDVAHVAGKHRLAVEAITPPGSGVPAARPDADPAPEQALAGAGLFRLAGFLDERFRRHDFAVGYESTRQWLLDGGLTRHGLPAERSAVMLAAVQASRPATVPFPGNRLTPRARLEVVRLLARACLIALYDVWAGPRGADSVRRRPERIRRRR